MATTVLEAKKRIPNLSRGELMKERKNGKIPAVFFFFVKQKTAYDIST